MVHLGTAGRLLATINGHFFVKFSREFANKSALYENNSLSYCNKSALYGNKSLSYCSKSALYGNNSLSYCNKSALFGINLFSGAPLVRQKEGWSTCQCVGAQALIRERCTWCSVICYYLILQVHWLFHHRLHAAGVMPHQADAHAQDNEGLGG
jgi:hypothetical protein